VIGKVASYYFEGEQDTYEVVDPLFRGKKAFIMSKAGTKKRRPEAIARLVCRRAQDGAGK